MRLENEKYSGLHSMELIQDVVVKRKRCSGCFQVVVSTRDEGPTDVRGDIYLPLSNRRPSKFLYHSQINYHKIYQPSNH